MHTHRQLWGRSLLRAAVAVWAAAAWSVGLGGSTVVRGQEPTAAGTTAEALSFERDIRPLVRAHCWHCHGGEGEQQAGLDLRLKRLLLQGGTTGPAIVPGDRANSLAYQRVLRGEMPPKGPRFTPDEIELFGRWIDAGAPTLRDEPPGLENETAIAPEDREHWAYRPLARPAVPQFAAEARPRTPIDGLLLAELQPRGLGFSPDADRLTLLRRVSFDLTGLPPTPEEVDAFLADPAADAYEQLVERLLASPRFGERWARHWLDLAGYADSDGYTELDRVRPFAYKYRDYVIRAFNADMPLDRFLVEQLAGDELITSSPGALTAADQELLIATGFLRMATDGTGAGAADEELARNQVLAETLKIVSTGLLGLSVGCAQCHDHRYDPIPQTDYYRLRAVFEPALDWRSWRNPEGRLISLFTDADRQRVAELQTEIDAIAAERAAKEQAYLAAALETELQKFPAEQRDALRAAYQTPTDQRTPEQQKLLADNPSVNISPGVLYQYNQAAADDLKQFDARIAEVAARRPVEDFIAPLTEPAGHLPVTYRFHRGDHRQPQEEVQPGGLTILGPPGEPPLFSSDDESLPTSGRRLAFARWLTSGRQPLTPRVLANQIWSHCFGRGLVVTPGDFGALGEPPSHPQLLDWLAVELVESGWSLKHLVRQLVLSTAYRQSSRSAPAPAAVDPENRLYWRASVRRLDAEAIRDRMLAASGALVEQLYGPAVPVAEDAAGGILVAGEQAVDPALREPPPPNPAFRRSIYVQVRRSQSVAFLQAFDAPQMETNCTQRQVSTVATQALLLMNNDFPLRQAGLLAQRVRREVGDDEGLQIDRAWRLALLRVPTEPERTAALEFLAAQRATLATAPTAGPLAPSEDDPWQALTHLCQVLLTTNEFLYVD